MDATHLDGRQVVLKSIPVRRGHQELEIARTVSSPELRHHPHNHCVPLLDVIEFPSILDRKLMVMPLLRPFNEPYFRTYGDFVDFFTQICEVSSTCHLRRAIGRPDHTWPRVSTSCTSEILPIGMPECFCWDSSLTASLSQELYCKQHHARSVWNGQRISLCSN